LSCYRPHWPVAQTLTPWPVKPIALVVGTAVVGSWKLAAANGELA